jgi:hypothetical protein
MFKVMNFAYTFFDDTRIRTPILLFENIIKPEYGLFLKINTSRL